MLNLNSLPIQIQGHCLSFLNDRDLFNVIKVSKNLKIASDTESLWRSLCQRSFSNFFNNQLTEASESWKNRFKVYKNWKLGKCQLKKYHLKEEKWDFTYFCIEYFAINFEKENCVRQINLSTEEDMLIQFEDPLIKHLDCCVSYSYLTFFCSNGIKLLNRLTGEVLKTIPYGNIADPERVRIFNKGIFGNQYLYLSYLDEDWNLPVLTNIWDLETGNLWTFQDSIRDIYRLGSEYLISNAHFDLTLINPQERTMNLWRTKGYNTLLDNDGNKLFCLDSWRGKIPRGLTEKLRIWDDLGSVKEIEIFTLQNDYYEPKSIAVKGHFLFILLGHFEVKKNSGVIACSALQMNCLETGKILYVKYFREYIWSISFQGNDRIIAKANNNTHICLDFSNRAKPFSEKFFQEKPISELPQEERKVYPPYLAKYKQNFSRLLELILGVALWILRIYVAFLLLKGIMLSSKKIISLMK